MSPVLERRSCTHTPHDVRSPESVFVCLKIQRGFFKRRPERYGYLLYVTHKNSPLCQPLNTETDLTLSNNFKHRIHSQWLVCYSGNTPLL